jgi:signal transduction histidine kinase
VTVYIFYAAVVVRTLGIAQIRARLPLYLALEVVFVVLFSLSLWRPPHRPLWQHLYFGFQSALIFFLFSLRTEFDFLVTLYVLLSFQAALIFTSRARWWWVTAIILLTGIPLIATWGPLEGLAVSLFQMTLCIVFPAYVAVTQEIEAGQPRRQALLAELQEANRQLTTFASQAEEFSAIQERNRVARELHDSVSQTMFSITLRIKAAQILLARHPDQLRPELEQLRALSQSALAQLRGLIAQLRPQDNSSGVSPTPQG